LSLGALFGMVYEHLSGCLILEDPSLRFLKLFQIVDVAHGDILKLVALVLGACRLLSMAKDTRSPCPIVLSKVCFQLISRSIVLHFWGPFQEHLSPHWFRVSTLGSCETILFGIITLFNLHPHWVVMLQIDIKNAFNNIFWVIIYRKLRDVKGPLGWTLSHLLDYFMVLIPLFTTSMGNMTKGSLLLNFFQPWGKVTP
jgi:hypothetical protein